jgi:hypothetical protein
VTGKDDPNEIMVTDATGKKFHPLTKGVPVEVLALFDHPKNWPYHSSNDVVLVKFTNSDGQIIGYMHEGCLAETDRKHNFIYQP